MKVLTLNFLTCAIAACKSDPKSFPLHPQDAELESVELDFSPTFLRNILLRIEWAAMVTACTELGLKLPASFAHLVGGDDIGVAGSVGSGDRAEGAMEGVEGEAASTDTATMTAADMQKITDEDLKALHEILIETQMVSGKLVCGNCGHAYAVKEGIANFLLPPHLV